MTILNIMLSISNELMYMLTIIMLQSENPPPPTTMSDPNVPGGGGTAIDTPIDDYTTLAFYVAISVGLYYFIKKNKLSKAKK